MSANVETLDGLERRLTLNLNMSEIETEVGKRLARLAKKVRMDGFRPGKAPMRLIGQRYGDEVRGEVMGEALQKSFFQAIEEQKLTMAGYPSFAQLPSGEEGQATFTATFEVYPQFVPGDVSQIKIERPVVEVTDADIDRTLEVLRKQRVQYHHVERTAQEGDRVHVDYVGRIGDEAFPGGEAKDFPVVLGEGRTLKDFEGALIGMQAGETKTLDITFPEDYFAKDVAGKSATFELTLKSVHEPRLPELDESFAHSMGIHEGGIVKLREEVAGNLRREVKRRVMLKVKEQVMQGLLDVTPFEVPKGLVVQESRSLRDRAVADLKARGMNDRDIHVDESSFEPQAKRRVSLSLLLGEIAQSNGIKAEAEQVKAMVEEFSQSYEDPAEVVEWYYQDPNRLREAESVVLEENIVGWVMERAQVTDKETSLDTLMGKA